MARIPVQGGPDAFEVPENAFERCNETTVTSVIMKKKRTTASTLKKKKNIRLLRYRNLVR
jgi:hypothetical protein